MPDRVLGLKPTVQGITTSHPQGFIRSIFYMNILVSTIIYKI